MLKLIKNKKLAGTIVLVVSFMILSSFTIIAADGYGAEGAENKEDFTIAEMLSFAIEDEYLARAEYEVIINEYGEQRPFSNILEAEEYHIELLEPLFEKYEVEKPADKSEDYVVVPDSIEAALETGVEAEIANIAMYDKFLTEDLPEDIEIVFEELKRGSENHLRSFENGLDRNNGRGQGYRN